MKREADKDRLHFWLLAGFFFIGAVAGDFCAARSDARTVGELSAFLRDSLASLGDGGAAKASWSALIAAYFRECAIAFFSAFTLFAPILLPCTALWFGFSLAYSACLFASSLGMRGIPLALALFGLRAAVTVPCFLSIAPRAWRISCGVSAAYLGRTRPANATFGREWWLRCALCAASLCLAAALDRVFSPILLRLVLPAGWD